MNSINSARRELLKLSGMGLAAAAATAVPAYAAPKPSAVVPASAFFDIRTYGAVGDGKTVDSPAINKAIEAAAAAGGGTVFFPAGTWLCFSIRLKSHVSLYLSQGCTILAADSPKPGETTGYNGGTYDAAEPKTAWDAYQDYGHNHWHNSLIWGEDINDVSITGPGLIWGKGLSRGARSSAVAERRFLAEQAGVGNKAIALKNCRNVLFRDFSILKGGHFGLLLTGVDNLTIDNLTIDTDRDGMDIDCCHNVRVSNCTVNSPWDDGICPKSSYALGYARATENVTITNCYVTGSYELGTVLDGTFKKFAPDVPRARAPAASSAAPNPTAASTTSPSPTASSKAAAASRSKASTARSAKTSPSPTSPCATSSTPHSSCASAPACAAPRRPPRSAPSAHPRRTIVVSYNSGSRLCSILSGIPDYPIEDVKLSNIYIQHAGRWHADVAKIVMPEDMKKYPEPTHVRPRHPGTGLLPPPHQQPRDEPRRDPARLRRRAPRLLSRRGQPRRLLRHHRAHQPTRLRAQ